MEDDKSKDIEARYFNQMDRQLIALGHFVQCFEIMVDLIRTGCLRLTANPDERHTRMMKIVFNYQNLTLFPLFEIFRSLTAEWLQDDRCEIKDEDKNIIRAVLAQLSDEIRSISETRNNIVHGTWRTLPMSDYHHTTVEKVKASKSGMSVFAPVASSDELVQHCEECDRLFYVIDALSYSTVAPHWVKASDHFKQSIVLGKKKWVFSK